GGLVGQCNAAFMVHRARKSRQEPRDGAQETRFADTIGTSDERALPRGQCQVESREEQPSAAPAREPFDPGGNRAARHPLTRHAARPHGPPAGKESAMIARLTEEEAAN